MKCFANLKVVKKEPFTTALMVTFTSKVVDGYFAKIMRVAWETQRITKLLHFFVKNATDDRIKENVKSFSSPFLLYC